MARKGAGAGVDCCIVATFQPHFVFRCFCFGLGSDEDKDKDYYCCPSWYAPYANESIRFVFCISFSCVFGDDGKSKHQRHSGITAVVWMVVLEIAPA